MTDTPGASDSKLRALLDGRVRLHVAIIIILSAIAVLPGAFGLALIDNDESRCAMTTRTMLDTGNWLVPYLEGQMYFKKPPLFFWMSAGLEWAGVSGQASGRLVSVLALLLTALLTYDLARRLRDRATGLIAASILITTVASIIYGRFSRMDMLLLLFVTLSLWSFIRLELEQTGGRQTHPWRWWSVFYISAALGTLTKGPIGLALSALIVGVFCLVTGRLRTILKAFNPLGLGLYLLISAPWFLTMSLMFPTYFRGFFLEENMGRFSTSLLQHLEPFWFYVPVLLAIFLPWSALMPVAVRDSFPLRLRSWRENWQDAFLWIAALTVVVFFSAAKTKLVQYVLPALVPLAVLVASTIRGRLCTPVRANRLLFYLTMVCVGFMFMLGIGLLIAESYVHASHWGTICLLCMAAAAGTVLFRFAYRLTVIDVVASFVALMAAAGLILGLWVEPGLFNGLSFRSLGLTIHKYGQSTDLLGYYRSMKHSFAYYAGRDQAIDFSQEGGTEALKELLKTDRRVWLLVQDHRQKEVEAWSQGRVQVVARQRNLLLMTNVPVPAD